LKRDQNHYSGKMDATAFTPTSGRSDMTTERRWSNTGFAGELSSGAAKPAPPAVAVELWPHDPAWAADAQREAARIAAAVGGLIVSVHHIGSTAVPNIRAKPILDLMPVVSSLSELDASRRVIEGLGYAWWGEYGLEGRRYCTFDDPETSRRKVQLHCFEAGSPEIKRLLIFRDFLRSNPDVAQAYEAEKTRCQALHPNDSNAYSACKGEWVRKIEAEALSA
jgi:GrpB-like predicted nucleotidyltransferase (UPF0157 family)